VTVEKLILGLIRVAAHLLLFYLRLRIRFLPRKAVLFVGQAYYNAWYLSRGLRTIGWRADVFNWDTSPASQIYYHGEDFSLLSPALKGRWPRLRFYLFALFNYDVFHFSNAHGLSFGLGIGFRHFSITPMREIELLRKAGKKIVYSNNGCFDGVSQTSFRKWQTPPVCDECRWRNESAVCSDARNLAWGEYRNRMTDYQCTLGGNRADFNDDPRVHEVPEFYCLDPEIWKPDLSIPEKFRLSAKPGQVRLYHSVGNFDTRTDESGTNIKSTHIYVPLVKRLQAEGIDVDFVFFSNVPNIDLRYYQVQADVFLDMLTFGFFGATAREAMMLGKPVVCYLRPSWLDSIRREVPGYVEELPVVSATPATAYETVRTLVADPDLRRRIGDRSRQFALKWHSSDAGKRRLARIYSDLLGIPERA